MSDDFIPEDDLEYEDFDDVPYTDSADDLDAIELDSLDDIDDELPVAEPPAARDRAVEYPLLDSTSTAKATPPVEELPAPTPADHAADSAPGAGSESFGLLTPEAADLPDLVEPAPATETDSLPAALRTPVAAPPDLTTTILLPPPPDLAAQILALRAAGAVDDMPPPGVVLAGPMRVVDHAALMDALAAWTDAHLPLSIELGGVAAEVVEAQQYVAAWSLEPAATLRAAGNALHRALAPFVEARPDAFPADAARLIIGERVPPGRFPQLIARMQREFAPVVWQAAQPLVAQRDDAGSSGAWEIVP